LYTFLDHYTLFTQILHGSGPRLPKLDTTYFCLDTINKSLFYNILEAIITHSQILANKVSNYNKKVQTRDLLDLLAESIIKVINAALSTSTKKTSRCSMGYS